MPRTSAAAYAVTYKRGQTQGEVGRCCRIQSFAGGSGRSCVLAVVEQHAEFTAIARVEDIDSIVVQLETSLDHVAAMGIGEVVIKLRYRGSKVLEGDGLPKIVEHAGRLVRDGSSTEPE